MGRDASIVDTGFGEGLSVMSATLLQSATGEYGDDNTEDGDAGYSEYKGDIVRSLSWLQPLLAVLTLISFGAWALQMGLYPASVTYSFPFPPPSPPGPPPSPPPPRPPTVPGSLVVDRVVFRLLLSPEHRARELQLIDDAKLKSAVASALSIPGDYVSITEETGGVALVHVLLTESYTTSQVVASINNPSFLTVLQYYAGVRYVFEHGHPDVFTERYATPAPPYQSPPSNPPPPLPPPPSPPPPSPPPSPPAPAAPPLAPPSYPPNPDGGGGDGGGFGDGGGDGEGGSGF